MTLAKQTQLGPYEILSPLGAGGMGEVYRARDTRVNRQVAIKLLPASFANDEDRLRRFEQESLATSALNHPNILTVHDFGTHEGSPYIIAELLEGEELRDQLGGGPMTLRKAIDFAQQITNGLAAAHSKGIVHRDLKPENIFITTDGRVKILDFGLAKLRPQGSPVGSGSNVETQRAITDPGTIMGTVGYMSPEQVRGQEVDHRSDLFSFGLILYEMLAGRRAFQAESLAETMAAIVKEDPPDLIEANGKVPLQLERLVRRCLEKKPDRRFQTASDLGFALEALSVSSGSSQLSASLTSALPASARRWNRERLLWGIAGLALGAVVAGILFWLLAGRSASPLSTSRPVRRLTIKLPDTEPLALSKFGPLGIGRTAVALSPDGSLLVYAAERNGKSQLFLRALSQFDARPMPGTEGANSPFFSPDGRSLGFFSENKLKKVSLQGGEPVTLCEARIPHGATWGTDDTIVLADSEGLSLSRVSASGGNKEVLPNKSADRAFFPQFLPGDKAVLYSTNNQYSPDYGKIVALTLATGEGRVVLEGGTNPRYAASGHLVFARAGAILAAPFDVSRLEVTGPAVTLIEGIRIEEWGAAQFALSSEGTLVYVNGGPAWIGKLTWVDQQGISKPLAAPAQAYGPVSISPDGQRLAVAVAGSTSDLWVYDLTRGTFNRLTVEGSNYRPLWTPDGKRIVYYRVNGPNQFQMVSQVADGSDLAEVLITSRYLLNPSSWSPDGKLLAIQENSADTGFDVLMLPLEGDRQPIPWLKTKFNEWGPVFSGDGKWIAYVSDESGTYEVYMRPYPGPGGKRQISTNGGEEVLWSRDGHTLFYRNALTWMSVAVQTQPEFRADPPKVMFEGPYLNVPGLSYDVAPDGKHFLMIEENQKQPPTTQLNVVLNWFEELKR
jgi:serine/threonine protein kinase